MFIFREFFMNQKMTRYRARNNQGFTLVEIAIVLIIIGALLGGVFQGTKLIDNAKVRKAVGELEGVAIAFRVYQDKYGSIPGDDGDLAALKARGGDWAFVTTVGALGTVLNTVLDVDSGSVFNTGADVKEETVAFWQQLRAEGLILGDPSAEGSDAYPTNAFGGLIGVAGATNINFLGGMPGVKVCMSNIPGDAAISIDAKLDDGKSNTGRIRGAVASNNSVNDSAGSYSNVGIFSICMRM